MELRPFFKYFGSKWRVAPKYPAPVHTKLIEPFAGSAGYATRYPSLDVTLCDLDPTICGVWDYLIKVKPSELMALPDLKKGESTLDLVLPTEAKDLIGFWFMSGAASPGRTPSTWVLGGTHPTCFWGDTIRRRLASQVHHIRHWRVRNCSYSDLVPSQVATWFVDPPYVHHGKHYRKSSKDMNFASLADWCRALQGQAMVCEGAGADWLPFEPITIVPARANKAASIEYVWVNT